ncbi:MAG: hypothetical protein ACM3XM_02400 [Mycobacterium leprae]
MRRTRLAWPSWRRRDGLQEPRLRDGSILMELVITLPAVLVLVLAGVMLVQIASAKAYLQMTASRAARELAASEAARRIPASGKLFRYGEFTETYGLPREHVKMLVGHLVQKEGSTEANYIVAGACYRVRAPFPRGTPTSDLFAEPMSIAKDLLPNEPMLYQLQETINNADAAYQEGENLWQRVQIIWDKLQSLTVHLADTDEFPPYPNDKKQASFSSQSEFDAAVRAQCGGKRDVVVNARAAFWSEQHFEETAQTASTEPASPEDPATSAPAQQTPKRTVELVVHPTEVMIDPNPRNMPPITATATASWPNARCDISVRYKGYSGATGLAQPTLIPSRDETTIYRWTWRLGTNVSKSARVAVTCDGITAVRPLVVYDKGQLLPWEE